SSMGGQDSGQFVVSNNTQRFVDRPDEVMAQIGDEATKSIRQSRPRRDQNLWNAEFTGQCGSMQWSRPSKSEQDKIARIVPARQRHKTNCAGHLVVGHPDYSRRSLRSI